MDQQRQREIMALAQAGEMQSIDPVRAGKLIKDTFREYGGTFEAMYLVDAKGIVIASNANYEGTSFADRDYFRQTMTGKATISDPVISRTSGDVVVVVTAPIKDANGQVQGLAEGTVSLTRFYQTDLASTGAGTGYFYLLDK